MILEEDLTIKSQVFLQKVRSIDLGPIAYQLTQASFGPQWSNEKTVKAIARYLAFLCLVNCYSNVQLIPSSEIDTVWHYHILDTHKYLKDCQKLFGCFIHHFPYTGIRDEADHQNLNQSYLFTQELFRKHFGEEFTIEDCRLPADCEPLRPQVYSNYSSCAYLQIPSLYRPKSDISTEETLEFLSTYVASSSTCGKSRDK